MRKLLVVLVALALLGSATAIQADYVVGSFWGSCQEALKAYSLWFDNCKTARDIDAAGNMFSCSAYFAEGPTLGICQRMVLYFYQDKAVQDYYQECVLPEFRFGRTHEVDATKCAKETAECDECLKDSTCQSFIKRNTANYQEYLNSTSSENCQEIAQQCDATTLGRLAFSACQQYYSKICIDNWLSKNAQQDKCYARQYCDPYVVKQQAAAI